MPPNWFRMPQILRNRQLRVTARFAVRSFVDGQLIVELPLGSGLGEKPNWMVNRLH